MGIQDAPFNDEAKQAALFAATQLSTKPEFVLPGARTLVEVVEILKVKTQVVAGPNYYITMKIKTQSGIKICFDVVEVVVLRKLGNTAAPSFTRKVIDRFMGQAESFSSCPYASWKAQ